MKEFDAIVIGAGPGGLAAAYPLAQSGSVLVVESDLWGGTCPNRGCDPKKMLYSSVETARSVAAMSGHGIKGEVHIDWADAMEFKRSYTSRIPEGTKSGLAHAGITTVHGAAKFVDSTTICISGEHYRAKNIVIATGQVPRPLNIPGADLASTSTDFLDLDSMPRRMVFIGGGYISCELANIAAAAGSKVTLIHHNDSPLRAFPSRLVSQLMEQMRGAGIEILLSTQVTAISQSKSDATLSVATSEGSIETDVVVNATGRQPDIENLNLAAAGVRTDRHGIVVNDFLQTSAEHIFAVGDVVSRSLPKLTPVAGFEGRYVAECITRGSDAASQPIQYPAIPTIVFGTEKLAQIGVSVEQAQREPENYSVEEMDLTQWYTYNRVQDSTATMMVVKTTTGSVVGAATLSSVADEVINQFADRLNDPTDAIYAYPSPASDMSYFL